MPITRDRLGRFSSNKTGALSRAKQKNAADKRFVENAKGTELSLEGIAHVTMHGDEYSRRRYAAEHPVHKGVKSSLGLRLKSAKTSAIIKGQELKHGVIKDKSVSKEEKLRGKALKDRSTKVMGPPKFRR